MSHGKQQRRARRQQVAGKRTRQHADQAGQRLQSGPLGPLFKRYITAGDLTSTVPSLDFVTRALAEIPLERTLDWVARMLAPSVYGDLWRDHQQRMAAAWANTIPGGLSLSKLLATGYHELIVPHVVLHLAQLALIHGSHEPAGDHERRSDIARYESLLPAAMFVLAHHEGSATITSPQSAPDGHAGEPVEPIELELAANLASNHRPFAASLFDRSERRWIEIPRDDADSSVVDLAGEYEAATGVRFSDLRWIGITLWARAFGNDGPRFGSNHLAKLGIGENRVDRALDFISAPLDKLREHATLQPPLGPYDPSPFGQWPLIRIGGDQHIIISPHLLAERTVGWLPLFDLKEAFDAQGSEGKRRAARAVGYLRRTTELHAIEVLSALAAASRPAGRLFDGKAIQSAYGTVNRNADCALALPRTWIVAEISSRSIMRGTAAGASAVDLLNDLTLGVVHKAEQLHSTISALRADEQPLTGAPSRRGPIRYRPVLVTTEGFPVTPLMTGRIHTMVAEAGYLQGPDTAPLVVVDIEGLEAAEAVAEKSGLTFAQLLAEHEASPTRNYAFRDWLILTHPTPAPVRIMKRWDRVLDPILDALDDNGADS